MKKFFFLVVANILTATTFFGQNNHWCYTDEHWEEQVKESPHLLIERANFEEKLYNWISKNSNNNSDAKSSHVSYVVPVVVHVIDDESGEYIISNEEIESGIKNLNLDLVRKNVDASSTRSVFKPYAASLEMEFRLAKIDPDGNCTNGIVHVRSGLTNEASNDVKSVSYWPSDKYFNIWVVRSIAGSGEGITLGYAQFPGGNWDTWGVVIRAGSFDSRTLTHEVGHCFSLYHTFQSSCGSDCGSTGDRVCDTPPVVESSQECTFANNTCSNDSIGPDPYDEDVVDQIENYMSYNDCQNMFTEGQKTRVIGTINNYSIISGLMEESNLVATGTSDTSVEQVCVSFTTGLNIFQICAGAEVSFKDESHGGVPVSWKWDFGDGNSSNVQNPTHIYDEPGTYSVTLEVSDGVNSDSKTITDMVEVLRASGGKVAPFYEGFEDPGFPVAADEAKSWTLVQASGTQFKRNTSVFTEGEAGLGLQLAIVPEGSIYELISPTIDFTQQSCNEFSFDVAYAPLSTSSIDELEVWYSKDCGINWSLLEVYEVDRLKTADPQTTLFIPDSNQWDTKTINFNKFAFEDNLRVKLKIRTGKGNYIYLDNLNFGCQPVSSLTEDLKLSEVQISPNPISILSRLTWNTQSPEEVNINLYNVVGEQVFQYKGLQTNSANIGKMVQHLPSGMYLLRLSTGVHSKTIKLVKE